MGRRVNYEIGHLPSAILYSNSSHATEDPEDIFRDLVKEYGYSATMLVRKMILAEYKTDSSIHKRGEPIFYIDLSAEDREAVLKVVEAEDSNLLVFVHNK
jgi:hypothetical protein